MNPAPVTLAATPPQRYPGSERIGNGAKCRHGETDEVRAVAAIVGVPGEKPTHYAIKRRTNS